jgi:hypothetical protein
VNDGIMGARRLKIWKEGMEMMQEREGYITTVLNVLLKDALAVKRFLC